MPPHTGPGGGGEGGGVSQEMKRPSGFEVSLWFLQNMQPELHELRGALIYAIICGNVKVLSGLKIMGKRRKCSEKEERK